MQLILLILLISFPGSSTFPLMTFPKAEFTESKPGKTVQYELETLLAEHRCQVWERSFEVN